LVINLLVGNQATGLRSGDWMALRRLDGAQAIGLGSALLIAISAIALGSVQILAKSLPGRRVYVC
jgi:hypothetical protein